MRKNVFLLFVVVFLLSTVLFAADQERGSANIILYGGNWGEVSFPHHIHQEALNDCTICHALFPQSAGSVQDFVTQERLKKKQVMGQCVACHRKLVKEGKTAGPTKCRECHSK
ncbi:MAG: cytochrome c3 family protein [Desulfatiglans sp.]|jgi:hypothetical protein|nr:cytochrome c3 family protein [Desulfatiglans sp.]